MNALLAEGANTDPGSALLGLLFLLVVVIAYWVPTLVAIGRKGNIASVAVINGFLGWTFFGWVFALALAFNKPADVQVHMHREVQP